MSLNNKPKSGKYFCVMVTIQCVLAILCLVCSFFSLGLLLFFMPTIPFLIFTIINFILSFRFKSAGGLSIRLISIIVFICALALSIIGIAFPIIGLIAYIVSSTLDVVFNSIKWVPITITAVAVALLVIMTIIVWMKCRNIPPVNPSKK